MVQHRSHFLKGFSVVLSYVGFGGSQAHILTSTGPIVTNRQTCASGQNSRTWLRRAASLAFIVEVRSTKWFVGYLFYG